MDLSETVMHTSATNEERLDTHARIGRTALPRRPRVRSRLTRLDARCSAAGGQAHHFRKVSHSSIFRSCAWSLSHMRELVPTIYVRRGRGGPTLLDRSDQTGDIDALSFADADGRVRRFALRYLHGRDRFTSWAHRLRALFWRA